MTAKPKTGLGRGLGELLQRTDGQPQDLPTVPGIRFEEIPVSLVSPNPKQPRQVFDQEQLEELASSIGEIGLLQPIVVRRKDSGFELVMGERRLRATKLAGLDMIPALVRATDDVDLLRDALLENLHRAQLNPLEEAAAYQQMLADFGCTQEELSQRVHRSRSQISNTIRLLRLPAPVQRRVAAGVLSAGHARALLALEDPAAMEKMAQRIVAEGLSVRNVEELVAIGDVSRETTGKRRMLREPNPRASSIQDALTEVLDTKVKVAIGKNRGRIVIEFGDEEDLDRVLNALKMY